MKCWLSETNLGRSVGSGPTTRKKSNHTKLGQTFNHFLHINVAPTFSQ